MDDEAEDEEEIEEEDDDGLRLLISRLPLPNLLPVQQRGWGGGGMFRSSFESILMMDLKKNSRP